MTVKELRERLDRCPPTATVLEDRGGELREVGPEDLVEDLFDLEQETAEGGTVSGHVLIFRAWS